MNDPPFSADGAPPLVAALVAGKYEVIRLIGRGGMGSVWEGRHASLGTRVAIKFVDAEHVDNEEARSRFVTEARAAAAIQSKHAIQIFDHGLADDGRPYIVMELLVGEPLDARIERRGRLPLAETARVIGQVCRALTRAHEAGIIHRDLKPENIFLVSSIEDDEEIAKVLDFGIAKIRVPFEGSEPTSTTATGAVLGTPYYMSPEQARGIRTIDHRSDLWSLGVIAYRCVTGVLPFEGRSVGDLLVNICTGPLPIPSHVVPDLPAAFDAWFLQAVDRDPERRFRSATELAEALGALSGVSLRRAVPATDTPLPAAAAVYAPFTSPDAARAGRTRGPAVAAASSTSTPFTSAPAVTKPSRGTIAAAFFAVLLGGSAGVLAVAKLAPPRAATGSPPAAAAQTAAAALVPSAPPLQPTATAAPSAVTSSSAAPTASTAGTRPVANISRSSPTAGSGATRPQPVATAAAVDKASAKTAAPLTVRPPPHPLSSADPGY